MAPLQPSFCQQEDLGTLNHDGLPLECSCANSSFLEPDHQEETSQTHCITKHFLIEAALKLKQNPTASRAILNRLLSSNWLLGRCINLYKLPLQKMTYISVFEGSALTPENPLFRQNQHPLDDVENRTPSKITWEETLWQLKDLEVELQLPWIGQHLDAWVFSLFWPIAMHSNPFIHILICIKKIDNQSK